MRPYRPFKFAEFNPSGVNYQALPEAIRPQVTRQLEATYKRFAASNPNADAAFLREGMDEITRQYNNRIKGYEKKVYAHKKRAPKGFHAAVKAQENRLLNNLSASSTKFRYVPVAKTPVPTPRTTHIPKTTHIPRAGASWVPKSGGGKFLLGAAGGYVLNRLLSN